MVHPNLHLQAVFCPSQGTGLRSGNWIEVIHSRAQSVQSIPTYHDTGIVDENVEATLLFSVSGNLSLSGLKSNYLSAHPFGAFYFLAKALIESKEDKSNLLTKILEFPVLWTISARACSPRSSDRQAITTLAPLKRSEQKSSIISSTKFSFIVALTSWQARQLLLSQCQYFRPLQPQLCHRSVSIFWSSDPGWKFCSWAGGWKGNVD